MASLVWDKSGERIFQAGVDRGVLFLRDGRTAAWNGLISVEDSSDSEDKQSYYLDGVKYLESIPPGDYVGKLTAFTYPEEFDSVIGIADVASGISYYNQPGESFHLSYRTKIGNDIEGMDYGYKIHILYNIIANSDLRTFNTINDSGVEPTQFAWLLSGIPITIQGFRPTVHISIDSTKVPSDCLQELEDILYGTSISDPYLPSIEEIDNLLLPNTGELIIVDHGDGTWSAIDESGLYITMLNLNTFQIDGADATYLDEDTYQISSTSEQSQAFSIIDAEAVTPEIIDAEYSSPTLIDGGLG